MRLLSKRQISFLAVLILTIPFTLSISQVNAQTTGRTETAGRLSFYLHFKQPDFANQEIDVQMQSFLSAVTLNASALNVQISNGYTAKNCLGSGNNE